MVDEPDNGGTSWPGDWPVQRKPPERSKELLAPGESLRKLAGCDIHLPRSVARATQHIFVLPGILSLPKKEAKVIGKVKGLGATSGYGQSVDVSLQLGRSLVMKGQRIPTRAKFLVLSIKKKKITVKAVLSSVHVFGEAQCLRETPADVAGIFHHSGVSLRAEKRGIKSGANKKSPMKTPKSSYDESENSDDEQSISCFPEDGQDPSPRRSSRRQAKSFSMAEEDSLSDSAESNNEGEEEYTPATERQQSQRHTPATERQQSQRHGVRQDPGEREESSTAVQHTTTMNRPFVKGLQLSNETPTRAPNDCKHDRGDGVSSDSCMELTTGSNHADEQDKYAQREPDGYHFPELKRSTTPKSKNKRPQSVLETATTPPAHSTPQSSSTTPVSDSRKHRRRRRPGGKRPMSIWDNVEQAGGNFSAKFNV